MSQREWDDLETIKQDIIDGKVYVDVWDFDDVRCAAEVSDWVLSDSQCKEVIARMGKTYDPNFGVCWDSVSVDIQTVLGEE